MHQAQVMPCLVSTHHGKSSFQGVLQRCLGCVENVPEWRVWDSGCVCGWPSAADFGAGFAGVPGAEGDCELDDAESACASGSAGCAAAPAGAEASTTAAACAGGSGWEFEFAPEFCRFAGLAHNSDKIDCLRFSGTVCFFVSDIICRQRTKKEQKL